MVLDTEDDLSIYVRVARRRRRISRQNGAVFTGEWVRHGGHVFGNGVFRVVRGRLFRRVRETGTNNIRRRNRGVYFFRFLYAQLLFTDVNNTKNPNEMFVIIFYAMAYQTGLTAYMDPEQRFVQLSRNVHLLLCSAWPVYVHNMIRPVLAYSIYFSRRSLKRYTHVVVFQTRPETTATNENPPPPPVVVVVSTTTTITNNYHITPPPRFLFLRQVFLRHFGLRVTLAVLDKSAAEIMDGVRLDRLVAAGGLGIHLPNERPFVVVVGPAPVVRFQLRPIRPLRESRPNIRVRGINEFPYEFRKASPLTATVVLSRVFQTNFFVYVFLLLASVYFIKYETGGVLRAIIIYTHVYYM